MSDLMRHCHGCGYYAPMQRWCLVGSAPERCSRWHNHILQEGMRLLHQVATDGVGDELIAQARDLCGAYDEAKEGGDDE